MFFKSVTFQQLIIYASPITQDGARQVWFTSKAREVDDIHKNESYKNYFWDFLKISRNYLFLWVGDSDNMTQKNVGQIKVANRKREQTKEHESLTIYTQMNLIKSTSVIFTQIFEKTPELYFLKFGRTNKPTALPADCLLKPMVNLTQNMPRYN